MEPYGDQFYLKKKVSYESQNNSEKKTKFNLKLIHQVFDGINISLVALIFILFYLSLDSQRKWSNAYKSLSETKTINNNLIDYISKTEEFYVNELESLNNYKKTKPNDLIYLDKIQETKESLLKKKFQILIEGIRDSKYQKGY